MSLKTSSSETATSEFFAVVANRSPEPLIRNATGTIRFDLAMGSNTEHWFVTFKKGEVGVSNRNAPADSVVRTDRAVFDEIVAGTKNASAAFLRGALSIEGDMDLVVQFCRLLPAPPRVENSGKAARRSKQ
jgi:predicted lipid carrier protein YhbT